MPILVYRPTSYVEADLTNYEELCECGFFADCGVPVPQSLPVPEVLIEDDSDPPDFFFAGNVKIVSDRLRSLLATFGSNTEFIRANVTAFGKRRTSRDYFILNVVDLVECFDYERSTYASSETGVSGIETLVLDEERAAGHDLFLVGPFAWGDECNPKAINNIIDCVSRRLAVAIIELGATGITFVLPSHWRDYPVENVAWMP